MIIRHKKKSSIGRLLDLDLDSRIMGSTTGGVKMPPLLEHAQGRKVPRERNRRFHSLGVAGSKFQIFLARARASGSATITAPGRFHCSLKSGRQSTTAWKKRELMTARKPGERASCSALLPSGTKYCPSSANIFHEDYMILSPQCSMLLIPSTIIPPFLARKLRTNSFMQSSERWSLAGRYRTLSAKDDAEYRSVALSFGSYRGSM